MTVSRDKTTAEFDKDKQLTGCMMWSFFVCLLVCFMTSHSQLLTVHAAFPCIQVLVPGLHQHKKSWEMQFLFLAILI